MNMQLGQYVSLIVRFTIVGKVCAYDTPHAACHTRMLPLRGFHKSHISTSGAKGV